MGRHDDQDRQQAYTYTPINASLEMRVLHLSAGLNTDAIKIDLSVKSIMIDATKYEALSYTWGTSSRTKTITLGNNAAFAITDNLYTALRRLRYRNSTRVLWIDAICIDQGNEAERGKQVQRMGDIYAAASRVLVWLGDANVPDDDDQSLIDTLDSSISPADFRLWRKLEAALLQTIPSWWTRLWTVQEYVKARAIPILCFSNAEIDVIDAMALAARIKDRARTNCLLDALLDALTMRNQLWCGGTQLLSIYDAVVLMRHGRTTDPRDRIYSMLSLLPWGYRRNLFPSYELSIGSVFAQATIADMRESSSLRMLSLAVAASGSIPSWSVDFTQQLKALSCSKADVSFILQWENLTSTIETLLRELLWSFLWGGDSTEKHLLKLRGRYVDTVVKTVSLRISSLGDSGERVILRSSEDFDNVISVQPISTASQQPSTCAWRDTTDKLLKFILSAVAQGSKSHKVLSVGPENYHIQQAFNNVSPDVREPVSLRSLISGVFKAYKQVHSAFVRLGGPSADFARSLDRIWEAPSYFRDVVTLAITDSGLLCLGREGVEVGDVLTLLRGAHQPTILRQRGECWSFCGLAAVAGLDQSLARSILSDIGTYAERIYVLE